MDAILRQARAAIQQGNLDQADALVTRAEDAHAHYPVWHFGATPSSVRRELAQAVRQNGGKKRPPAIPQNGPQTRAAKTLRDLRVAEVSELDIQLKDGKVQSYRAKVKVSFKYEGP